MSQAELAVGGHAGMMEEAPFAIPSSKLVMWLFIISDAVTFGAMLFAYGYVRNASANWPAVFESSSIWNALLMTFILVSSSLTILLAVNASQSGDRKTAFRWIMITGAGGALFALLHLREWSNLIGAGLRPFSNPWGSPLFGASFFCVTGLHMAHVIAGVVALVVVGVGFKSGRYPTKYVENMSLYWHFVDLVWMFVVPLIYLLNMKR